MTEVAPAAVELDRQQRVLGRLLAAEGAGHVVHDLPVRADGRAVALESRPWRIDPQPYVLSATEFEWLAGAVRERMWAAEAILADLYGDRRLVQERIIEPASLWATHRYRLAAVDGNRAERWLTTYAVDVARDVNGVWWAIQDLTDAPTGMGYALLDRSVFAQAVGFDAGLRPRAIEPILIALRRACADLSAVDGPRVVVFSGGIDHESYVEHSYIGTKLGFNLVEAADLVVRRGRVWLRTLSGLEAVDVILRRLEDHRLDPMEVNAGGSAGIPGVLQATASGTVAMANAHGSGVMEADSLASSWDDAAEFLTGHRPALALRPPGGAPVGTTLDSLLGVPAERVPVWGNGVLTDRPIVVRLHAVATVGGIVVMPGGNGRILDDFDDPRIPTPCVAKDIWVLGADSPPTVTGRTLPQVDLISSVPTRAAESLFWLGRSAERAEVVARMTRVVLAERDLEVGPLDAMAARLVASVAGGPSETTLVHAVDWAAGRCVAEVGSIIAESASVREFLSSTSGRVLGAMADVRSALQSGRRDVDTFDELLLLLSAFSGLWSESVVRGPAWHFGDLARRLERILAVLESMDVTWRAVTEAGDNPSAVSDRSATTMMELLLAGHDSLVAYRRRHRSDVEWSQVFATIAIDARNPRSLAASAERLGRDAAVIDWSVPELTDTENRWTRLDTDDAFIVSAAEIRELAMRLTRDRLATPPDPAVVRSAPISMGQVGD